MLASFAHMQIMRIRFVYAHADYAHPLLALTRLSSPLASLRARI